MSYHIYTTDGIILKRKNFGESNSLFYVLTKDLGLVIVSAQAVRSSASKLSPALQEFSLSSISCVKGKNGWKMTNAIAKENFYFNRPSFSQRLVCQIAEVLVRMMPGEQAHPEIFSLVQSGFAHLSEVLAKPSDSSVARSDEVGFREKEILDFECLLMLRILYLLGYVDKNKQTEKFLLPILEWNKSILMEVSFVKPVLIEKINLGLKESHL